MPAEGITPLSGDAQARLEPVYARIKRSASGYILAKRFSKLDKRVAKELIREGRVELFSASGLPAYRALEERDDGEG